MIMVDDSFLLPEVWFHHVPNEVAEGELATAYAVGFTTAKYAERIQIMSQEEVTNVLPCCVLFIILKMLL